MADPAVYQHYYAGYEIQQIEPALALLSRIPNCLVATNDSHNGQDEENPCDPEVGVFVPNGFGRWLLVGHVIILPAASENQ